MHLCFNGTRDFLKVERILTIMNIVYAHAHQGTARILKKKFKSFKMINDSAIYYNCRYGVHDKKAVRWILHKNLFNWPCSWHNGKLKMWADFNSLGLFMLTHELMYLLNLFKVREGQFLLERIWLVWIQSFPSPRLTVIPELKSTVCPTI